MNTKDSKAVLELKKALINVNANVSNLYKITSALYQEINDIKRFISYKNENSLGDVESNSSNLTNNANSANSKHPNNLNDHFNVLNNVEEFADTFSRNYSGSGGGSGGGRRLKVINN